MRKTDVCSILHIYILLHKYKIYLDINIKQIGQIWYKCYKYLWIHNVSEEESRNICQYNEDCPSSKYCDRLNRKCIDPCLENDCGVNANCYPENHQAQCKCLPGFQGNPEVGCTLTTTNPCVPNPCGLDAMCENDNGNPICFCPKGLTGNPFEQCSKFLKYIFFSKFEV